MSGTFCANCGAPQAPGVRFCGECGAVRDAAPRPSEPSPSEAPATAGPPGGSSPFAAATRVAATASTVAALPWQTVVAGQAVDVETMARTAGVPLARRAVQRSLRRPGIALAVTTALDLLVTWVADTGSVGLALPRVGLGAVAAALAIATGTKAGRLRLLTGAVSTMSAVVGLATAVLALADLPPGTDAITVLSMAVAAASAVVMAVRTAWDALRRPA